MCSKKVVTVCYTQEGDSFHPGNIRRRRRRRGRRRRRRRRRKRRNNWNAELVAAISFTD